MNCTYVDYYTQSRSSNTTRCATTVSDLGSGQYYCTVVIGGEYFTSNVKILKRKPSDPGSPKTNNITEPVLGSIGGVLLLALLVSVMITIYACFRRRQHQIPQGAGDGVRQPHVQGNKNCIHVHVSLKTIIVDTMCIYTIQCTHTQTTMQYHQVLKRTLGRQNRL